MLLNHLLLIEGLSVVIFGVLRRGIEVRRLLFIGLALIIAYFLPSLFHLAPGSYTYYQLYEDVEGMIGTWSLILQIANAFGLGMATAMVILQIAETIATGGAAIPVQMVLLDMNMGFVEDALLGLTLTVVHVAQVMIAVLHTIAYLAWFSYAVAPIIMGIAVALMIPEKTRHGGTAIFTVTLTILFITVLAANSLGIIAKESLLNNTIAIMSWLREHSTNATLWGYLALNGPYPYLVSGGLYQSNYEIIKGVPNGAPNQVLHQVSTFVAFTPSLTPINALGYPRISNVTFLWLSIRPSYECVVIKYINSSEVKAEPCSPTTNYNDNATYLEIISFGPPPFNVVSATLNGTTMYTGAWEWVSGPSHYTVRNGNNTAVISFEINVPPEYCINYTSPRTHIVHKVCYPGTASAALWYFASSAKVLSLSSVGNTTYCTYSYAQSHLYKEVNIGSEEEALEALIGKLNQEINISRAIMGSGSLINITMPEPAPIGYNQGEVALNCINYLNRTVTINGVILVTGVVSNPWYAHVPLGLTPSTSWIINSIVVGAQQILSGWFDIKELLNYIGFFIPSLLAEGWVIFGMVDAGLWALGFPSILSPAWALMYNVVMDLSLILYMRIAGVNWMMRRIARRVSASLRMRAGTLRERVGQRIIGFANRHRRFARAIRPLARAHGAVVGAISRIRRWVVRHSEYLRDPVNAALVSALGRAEARLRRASADYAKSGNRLRARAALLGAYAAWVFKTYPRAKALGEEGRLYQLLLPHMRLGVYRWDPSELKLAAIKRVVAALRGGGPLRERLVRAWEVRPRPLRYLGDVRIDPRVKSSGRPVIPPRLVTAFRESTARAADLRAARGELVHAMASSEYVKGLAGSNQRLFNRLIELMVQAQIDPSPATSRKLLALTMAPYVQQLHSKAFRELGSVREFTSSIRGLISGAHDINKNLSVLAKILGAEEYLVRRAYAGYLSTHVKELVQRHINERETIIQARDRIRGGLGRVLNTIKSADGVISVGLINELSRYFRGNPGAIRVINEWYRAYSAGIDELIKRGASPEDLRAYNRVMGRELTRALAPYAASEYRREALQIAGARAVNEARPMAMADLMRELRPVRALKSLTKDYREYRHVIHEMGGLLVKGASALKGGETFGVALPKIAKFVMSDSFTNAAAKYHLITTAHSKVATERLARGGIQGIFNLVSESFTARTQPLVLILSRLSELGIDLNEAVDWRRVYEICNDGSGADCRVALRTIRALYERGILRKVATVGADKQAYGVPKDVIAAAFVARPDDVVAAEFQRAFWSRVIRGREAWHPEPGEYIGVRSIGEQDLRRLLQEYASPRVAVNILDQADRYVLDRLVRYARDMANSLGDYMNFLQHQIDYLMSEANSIMNSDKPQRDKEAVLREIAAKVEGLRSLRNSVASVKSALDLVLTVVSSPNMDVGTRVAVFRDAMERLRNAFTTFLSNYEDRLRNLDAGVGLLIANYLEALAIIEANLSGFRQFMSNS